MLSVLLQNHNMYIKMQGLHSLLYCCLAACSIFIVQADYHVGTGTPLVSRALSTLLVHLLEAG